MNHTYAPGARIVVRDEEWIVRTTKRTSTGGQAVHCTGLSELVRNKDAIFLTEIDTDIEELKPEDTQLVPDDSPRYRKTRLYLESLLRQTPPSDDKLYIGHRAAMDPAPYQLEPAAQALAQPRPRILIADAVGLGKTLETGVLLSELVARGRGRRILVVALKSILEQFQLEMWARFTIPLVRLDSVGLQRVQSKLPSNMNPFYVFDRVIISIDTLKRDEKYRRYLEACHWDVIVIDECQHVADRSSGGRKRSQRARLAALLGRTCDALIMTSATPHDGRPESFASLMNLLEPTAIANVSDYTREDIDGLFVRRFKKDVAHQVDQQFQERSMHVDHVPATALEDHVFQLLQDLELRTIDRGKRRGDHLFKTTLLKSFLSSPAALIETVENRLRSKRLRVPQAELVRTTSKMEDKDSEPLWDDRQDPEAAHDRVALDILRTAARASSPQHVAKLVALSQKLAPLGLSGRTPQRVVIFSERIPTLRFLKDWLETEFELKPGQVEIFHGSLDDISQQKFVKDFGSAQGKVRVLLCSDAASEGINLHHYCHHMVHFDLPWSLITLEQRNGRIDRFGQTERPEIHYLLTLPGNPELKGDLRILDRLIEKEAEAHKNLGDVAWLMDLHDNVKEEEAIAVAIETGANPDEVIPDSTAGTGDDFLDMMLGLTAAPVTPSTMGGPVTAQVPTLFEGDLAYAREAFAQLQEDDPAMTPPDWHEDPDAPRDRRAWGLTVYTPDDLQRRLAFLPREVVDDNGNFNLTIKRDRVTASYAQAREKNHWPEWQLFWPMHPVAEWLNDRALALFRRHEAPVLRVLNGLDPGEAVFVLQGVLSNARSQPVLVEWFGVRWKRGEQDSVVSFEQLVADHGLAKHVSNPGRPPEVAGLQAELPRIIGVAEAHMAALREARSKTLGPALRVDARKVKRWRDRSLSDLQAELDGVQSRRSLRKDEEQRFGRRRQEIERRFAARQEWIDEGLRTSEVPYLRVAAVLVG